MTFSASEWAGFIDGCIAQSCESQGIVPSDVTRIRAGFIDGRLKSSLPAESLQRPPLLFPGLKAKPWHNAKDHPWTQPLVENYEAIREELDFLMEEGSFLPHPETVTLASRGSWSEFRFYSKDRGYDDNCRKCPLTAKSIEESIGLSKAGSAFFSRIAGGTHLAAHCGPHNLRIRAHLGLIIPDGCKMRVGTETRPWTEGAVSVFDDSFEHEVWIDSSGDRTVLLVDTWHPDLTSSEVEAFRFVDAVLANMSKDYALLGQLPEVHSR